jgi:hypothetical protein
MPHVDWSTRDPLKSALDWLCLNIPEDRLPIHFGPQKGHIELKPFGSQASSVRPAAAAAAAAAVALSSAQEAVVVELVRMGFEEADSRVCVAEIGMECTLLAALEKMFYAVRLNAFFFFFSIL